MNLRYLFVVCCFFCGCTEMNPFLKDFTKNDLSAIEPVCALDENIIQHVSDIILIGDYIIWNSSASGGEGVFYRINLNNYRIDCWTKEKLLGEDQSKGQQLFKENDTILWCFDWYSQRMASVLNKDTMRKVGDISAEIRNIDDFHWIGIERLNSVCPLDSNFWFVGAANVRPFSYAVYGTKDHLLYASWSCMPPSDEDMIALFPDNRESLYVVRQKDGNRLAVFRRNYQSIDIMEHTGKSLKYVNRILCRHTPLTWKDQYNRYQLIVHPFFQGFFVSSNDWLLALYQPDSEESQFILEWDWSGKPRNAYRIPSHIRLTGMCGENPGQFYALGRYTDGKSCLFSLAGK